MGKNVAVFVDVANIFYAAKAAGVDIDYVLLLKAATAGRDLVRAYAYTGLDPDNENQRNFHAFLGRNNFKVVSKDIRKYGDGKVKANLDIELVVDMLKTSRNLDVAVVVSGDGDFAPAIRAVQEMGVRVEVISFRGNTSSDLIEVADRFTDITQLAKVDRTSTASGRRVASDDEDLSMTEVPDKLSEGTGRGRRGRGRARPARTVEEPVAAAGRGRGRARAAEPADRAAGLVALPGERLSKAAVPAVAAAAGEAPAPDEEELPDVEAVEGESEEGRRRRRRRGGRGRGRGRGQEQASAADGVPAPVEGPSADEDEEVDEPTPRAARPAAFGSVWDSQIGVPSAPRVAAPLEDEEYDDEPAVPEYLLAERRRGGRGQRPGQQRPGQRGRGGAYAAAVERERYGGRGPGRPTETAPRSHGAGTASVRGPRPARPSEPAGRERSAERRPSSEPWSEVPPEIEALLRAQLAQRQERPEPAAAAANVAEAAAGAPSAPARRTRRPAAAKAAQPAADAAEPAPDAGTGAATPARRTRRPAAAKASPAEAPAEAAPQAAAARRTRRSPAAKAETAETQPDAGAAPARRTRRAPAAGSAPDAADPAGTAPARRSRRATAATTGEPAGPADAAPSGEAAAPRRRTRRTTPAEGG